MVLFKTPLVQQRSKLLHPLCIDIMIDQETFCRDHGFNYVVSETVTTLAEDNAFIPVRKSATHREFRAWDLSVHGWTDEFTKLFIEHFNDKYKYVAAITPAGVPTLVVDETDVIGRAAHLHNQINAKYYKPTNGG